MNILAISGSASKNSSNFYLLKAIAELFQQKHDVEVFQGLYNFNIFTPTALEKGLPDDIQALKSKILAANALIISTPEYTHNIPAVLKNLLEWCTASGEFANKKVVAISFTPHEPRGDHAMSSLLASLKTLDAKVLAQFSLYKSTVEIQDQQINLDPESKEMLEAAMELLEG